MYGSYDVYCMPAPKRLSRKSAGHRMASTAMDRKDETPHYHIRWSRVVPLDWECFSTRAEAEARAKQLVRQDETYAIEKFDGACARCRDALSLKSEHGIEVYRGPE